MRSGLRPCPSQNDFFNPKLSGTTRSSLCKGPRGSFLRLGAHPDKLVPWGGWAERQQVRLAHRGSPPGSSLQPPGGTPPGTHLISLRGVRGPAWRLVRQAQVALTRARAQGLRKALRHRVGVEAAATAARSRLPRAPARASPAAPAPDRTSPAPRSGAGAQGRRLPRERSDGSQGPPPSREGGVGMEPAEAVQLGPRAVA